MTDTKPEALRLADELLFAGRFAYETEDGAARRRIARNFKVATELCRLHEVNAELLEALKAMCQSTIEDSFNESAFVKANAAIAKAEVTK
jgi:hypothetical protein